MLHSTVLHIFIGKEFHVSSRYPFTKRVYFSLNTPTEQTNTDLCNVSPENNVLNNSHHAHSMMKLMWKYNKYSVQEPVKENH